MKRYLTLSACAVLKSAESLDVKFVPPLMLRRLSALQKIYFHLAKAVEKNPAASTVFSSRDGEDSLTRRLVDEFHEEATVSPHRFSASVYNAAPGLWSVYTKNRAPYTAVAAGEDSIECGLLEILGDSGARMFVYAEETGGGYGASLFFDDDPSGRKLVVTGGDPSRKSVTFTDLCDFISGGRSSLDGRWITIKDAACEER
jgi:hypothetical protein